MTFSRLSAALTALTLLAPAPIFAQSAASPAAAQTCLLMGMPFTKGATVRMTGERVRCDSNEDGPFWNRDVEGDENGSNFIFCVFEGDFYTQGANLNEMTCNGNGNWG